MNVMDKVKKINTLLKKDDEVIVISGADKGKRGKIQFIDRVKSRVIVQGINKKRRFQRPTQENPKGSELEVEYPIHISNVMFYDAKTKKGVRLGTKRSPDGKRVRIARTEGKEV